MIADGIRPVLTDEELLAISKDDLILKWKSLSTYNELIENNLKESEENLKKKTLELIKLKNLFIMNNIPTIKENDLNKSQPVDKLTTVNSTSTSSTSPNSKNSFVDPSINALVFQLKKELEDVRKKKDELQIELSSTKFTPESQLVKRLMLKCRKLLEENKQLGKIISTGNVAQLEHDLAYHKQLLNEASENEQNLNSFLDEVDREMDLMQATILELNNHVKQENITESPQISDQTQMNVD